MDYKEFGKTGMKFSTLAFGASSLGGVFHAFDEQRGIDAVVGAVEAGINYIDVSPYYGYGKAEVVLGKALQLIPRDKYHLSTKVGRYGEDGHNTWDYSADRVTRSVHESMARLHIDYIDIVYVHDIEFADLRQVASETLPALHALKQQGLVGHVGCTDLQLENLQWIIEHTPAGTVEGVLNFCHYCLNDDKLTDYMDFFDAHDVGFVNASPFSMGLLTQRGVPQWHPAPSALVESCRKAADYCKSQGYPIEKLAIQYACSNDRICSTVFSTTSAERVRQNLGYLAEPIDWALVEKVRELVGDQFRVSWKNS